MAKEKGVSQNEKTWITISRKCGICIGNKE